MELKKDRRAFIQKFGYLGLGLGTVSMRTINPDIRIFPEDNLLLRSEEIRSLSPQDIFDKLDLARPSMKEVKAAYDRGGFGEAVDALLDYYRRKFPLRSIEVPEELNTNQKKTISEADDIVNHIFQWGPYESAEYGPEMDWAADPANDIEWVAAMHRFYWTADLVKAYRWSQDEKYVNSFVELTTDWIRKHPLEETIDVVHPVYGPGVYGKNGWKGYPWLDIQTGRRAKNLCDAFRVFVHSPAFSASFLAVLTASMYDHLKKTEMYPMNMVHNKAIFEQRGFLNILQTFSEFKERDIWIDQATKISTENLLAQTTTDGVQREWCGGYHSGVYIDGLEISRRMKDLDAAMPEIFDRRLKSMADHIFGLSTPDLGFPMFGDTARPKRVSEDRKDWQLYRTLINASGEFGDEKYRALAELRESELPSNGSTAFAEAGLYAMRSNWTPDQVYMAVHCSPPAISSHDTPDNGTFELYAYGTWLMPDSGFFTYGNNPAARAWHRKTSVHATMTVDDRDTRISGRHLMWDSDDRLDVLCVENQSYERLLHRRTFWLAGKKEGLPFFVILDEGIGDAGGKFSIRYPMAPGKVRIDPKSNRILTDYPGKANLVIQTYNKLPLSFREEAGWHAWAYGKREPRSVIASDFEGRGPFAQVSVLVPFEGNKPPEIKLLSTPEGLFAGMDPVVLEIEIDGKPWELRRQLS